MQKTLNKSFSLSGITLHSGKYVSIRVQPATANTGIVFRRTDLKVPYEDTLIEAKYENVSTSELCTKLLNKSGISVSTVEHILSAFHGLGIDNAVVEIDNDELPILDGSSIEYVINIEKVGIKKLNVKRKLIKLLRPVLFSHNDSFVKVTPSDNLSINYTIVYDHKFIKEQKYYYELNDKNEYKNLISNCRTFGFKEEFEYLKGKGLIAGGSLDNALVLEDNKILNDTGLRQEKEFVKHKILDFIGDIYLLGYSVKGAFEIYKGGHRITHEVMKSIMSDLTNWTYEEERIDKHQESKSYYVRNLTAAV